MKILNRIQITEVTIKRSVFHDVLAANGKTYIRELDQKFVMPHHSGAFIDDILPPFTPYIKWRERTGNIVRDLSKKEVKDLQLEKQFEAGADWQGYSWHGNK